MPMVVPAASHCVFRFTGATAIQQPVVSDEQTDVTFKEFAALLRERAVATPLPRDDIARAKG
jgi:hypothetical protein